MFQVLKVVVWTALAVGFGVFLAQYEVDGRTPIEHAQRAWKQQVDPSAVDGLKAGLRDALDDAKETISEKARPAPKTHGNYSEEERRAIDRIIAQGKAAAEK